MHRRLWKYLNPITHLGERRYSIKLPILMSVAIFSITEIVGNFILNLGKIMGTPAVIIALLLVLYLSFRCAIRGGLVASAFTSIYFAYFIYSREANMKAKVTAAVTAAAVASLCLLITWIIGGLRQRIDELLEKEQNARAATEHDKRQLEALLKQLPVGVILAEATSGEIIGSSDKVFELLGKHKPPATSISDYWDLTAYRGDKKIGPHDWPLSRALAEGKTILDDELIVEDKTGRKMNLFFNAAPILDKNGSIVAAVTTFYDITKQKELERQKDDFVAMISHELKTPITSAKIYAQAVLRETTDKRLLAFVDKMHGQLDRLAILINTMLDSTRMERGKLELVEEPFDLKDIAVRVLDELQDTTDHRLSLDWKCGWLVYANKERISQIIVNLVTNAIKYSPRGSEIIIRSRSENGSVVVSVQDFGVGLSPDAQKRVFERFYQSDEHKTYPGLGLGLYISSEIIKTNGGRMWVESMKDKGSTFSFSLPAYKEHEHSAETEASF